jgi:hypothetical protein
MPLLKLTFGAIFLQFLRQSDMQSACAYAFSGPLNPTPKAAAKAPVFASIDLLSIFLILPSGFAQSCDDERFTFGDVENAFALAARRKKTKNFHCGKLLAVDDYDLLLNTEECRMVIDTNNYEYTYSVPIVVDWLRDGSFEITYAYGELFQKICSSSTTLCKNNVYV